MEPTKFISLFKDYSNTQKEAMKPIKKLCDIDRALASKLFNVCHDDASIINLLSLDEVLKTVNNNSNLFRLELPANQRELELALASQDISEYEFDSPVLRAIVMEFREAQLKAIITVRNMLDCYNDENKETVIKTTALLTSISVEDCRTLSKLNMSDLISLAQRYSWVFVLGYRLKNKIFTESADLRSRPRLYLESAVIY